MSNKIFLCHHCGWKKTSELSESGLYQLKSDSMSSKKFRCPGCGRAITPRPAADPQSDLNRKTHEEKIKLQNKKWMEENIRMQSEFSKEN